MCPGPSPNFGHAFFCTHSLFLCAQHKFICPLKLWRLFLFKSSVGSHGNNRSPLKHGLTFPSTWILSPLWVLGSNACIPSDVFGGVTTCTSNKPSNRHALRFLPTWQMHSVAIHLWCVKSPGTCAFRLFGLNAEVLQSLPGPLILILDRRPSEISDFNCMSSFWRHNEFDAAFFEGLKAAALWNATKLPKYLDAALQVRGWRFRVLHVGKLWNVQHCWLVPYPSSKALRDSVKLSLPQVWWGT